MKILIYADYFFPLVGGVQTSIDLLARGLVEFNARSRVSRAERIDITVVTRTAASGIDDSAFSYRVVRQPGFLQLLRLIRAADVVHLAGPCFLPLGIAWLLRKPTVIEHHGYQAVCPNGLLFEQPSETACSGHFMERRYGACLRCCFPTMGTAGSLRALVLMFPRRWLSKKAAANVAISNHTGARLELPRMRTIYYGIDVIDPEAKRDTALHPVVPEIAYVGRLVAEKGLPVLLEAARLLKQGVEAFELILIGDGPERGPLEEWTRQSGLQNSVTFMGELTGPSLEQAVRRAAVLVMPSVWEETAGLSAIEQMMRGRPVIAAEIGGLSEVVGDAGLKFAPGDSQALASCIQRVIGDPVLAASLGAAARRRAMGVFTRDCMTRNHVALYRELLDASRE
jgi:glycosyltransferase involved in cell wall biosynthesis